MSLDKWIIIYLAERDLYVLYECRSHTPYLNTA